MNEHNMNCEGETNFPDPINVQGEVIPHNEYISGKQEVQNGESDRKRSMGKAGQA